MTYHETLDILEGVGPRRHHLWAELGLPVPMAMTVRVVLVDWAKYVRYPCCLMPLITEFSKDCAADRSRFFLMRWWLRRPGT